MPTHLEPNIQLRARTRVPADLTHFYVITMISNPRRFRRRYELYNQFAKMVEAAGVKMITVEQAFGDRQTMVIDPQNPYHVYVQSFEEIWLKENLVNIGIRHAMKLDPNARYVAWVDADCFPMCPGGMREWFEETWHALQHYHFVQMWRHLVNFGPNHEVIGEPQLSFMASYELMGYQAPKGAYKGTPSKIIKKGFTSDYTRPSFASLPGTKGTIPDQLGRPGLAWSASIEALNHVGLLLDRCILGSGDWHMSHAIIGACTEQTTLVGTLKGHGSQEYILPNYTHYILSWQELCERWIKRDVGHVDVTVGHWWHGKYKDRKYGSRGKILVDNEYNPYTDVKYDAHGMLQLEVHEPRQMRLRDQIRGYFKERNEDSIDVS